MMPRKHETDHDNQGSLLPPEAGDLAVGQTVEIEGVYYPEPEAPPEPELTPEQQALKAEASAITMLALACRSGKRIKGMEARQHNLAEGDVEEGTDVPTESHDLAHRDGHTGEAGGYIPKATQNRMHFRRQAKKYFGQSLGVETIEGWESRTHRGVPQRVLMVRAKDPSEYDEFERRFREFCDTYGQPHQKDARQQRIREIETTAQGDQ